MCVCQYISKKIQIHIHVSLKGKEKLSVSEAIEHLTYVITLANTNTVQYMEQLNSVDLLNQFINQTVLQSVQVKG